MASTPSRTQLVERRWNRCRQTSAASSDRGRRRAQASELDTGAGRRLNLKNCFLGFAGFVALSMLANAGLAWLRLPSAADINAGKELFVHKWEVNDPLSAAGDGLGPVFNAHSCGECHFQGGVGGAGGMQHNVAAFEVLPTLGHPEPTGGVIHAFAARPEWQETLGTLRGVFPIVPQGVTVTAVCTAPLRKDYDPVVHHSINTPTLFGAGAIDRISAVSLRALHTQRQLASIQREFDFDFKQPGPGRLRLLPDGRIGKFGWKAQFATLEEFVANACAVEVGLTTPTRKQHQPQKHSEDPVAKPDLNARQFTQLVAFVSQLPAPQWKLPADSVGQSQVKRGRELFAAVGCTECHTPDVAGVQGVYSDFCLHDVTDHPGDGYSIKPEVPVPDAYPRPSEWKTPPLWGVAQTAPYFHDGAAPTLNEAIQAHGGQAKGVREKFRHLPESDRMAIIRFLESLVTNSGSELATIAP